MPPIVVDTNTFLRLEGEYKPTLECILTVCDVIAVTKEILKEYGGVAYPSRLIIQSFLRYLHAEGKLEFRGRSSVDSAVRRYENRGRINYPDHHRDRKWVRTAIAVRAKYILSTDPHLLKLRPNRHNDDMIEVMEPSTYVHIRCG